MRILNCCYSYEFLFWLVTFKGLVGFAVNPITDIWWFLKWMEFQCSCDTLSTCDLLCGSVAIHLLPLSIDGVWEMLTGLTILRLWRDGCHFADGIWKCIFWSDNWCILIQLSLKFGSFHLGFFHWMTLRYAYSCSVKQPWYGWIVHINSLRIIDMIIITKQNHYNGLCSVL